MKIKDLKSPYREIFDIEQKEQYPTEVNGESCRIDTCIIFINSRVGFKFFDAINKGKYPPITPEIKSLYPELKEVFDRCEKPVNSDWPQNVDSTHLPDLGTPEKPFDEVLDETVKETTIEEMVAFNRELNKHTEEHSKLKFDETDKPFEDGEDCGLDYDIEKIKDPLNRGKSKEIKVEHNEDLGVFEVELSEDMVSRIREKFLNSHKWKWHLTSITNNSGNKQKQFKMSDFGEPYEIEKINDVRYKFKLPTNDGWVLGFGVKIFVE